MSELLEKILSKDNMNTAYKRVCANKGAGGVDGVSVEELGDHIKENWESIRNQIRSRKYKPQPVRRVKIPKPNGGVRGERNLPTQLAGHLFDFLAGLWEIVGHYGHNGYFQKFDRTIKDSYGYEGDDLSNSS